MKLKGINPFEQYVDKLVLGVVAAAALGVVAMQFLTEPNKVTIGKDSLPPARAYDPVRTAAIDLIARVNSDSPALPPDAGKVEVLARFTADMKRGVSPAPTLAPMGPVLALGASAVDLGGGGSGPVAALSIPAPGNVVARAFGGTIDPLEAVGHPELRSILPAEQPFDKFAVSIECAFEGTAFKQALQADPDGPGGPIRAIPPGWVRDSLEIIGVEAEREQMLDSGGWGKPTLVPPIPGRPDLLGEYRKTVRSVGDAAPMLQRVQARSDDAQRPEYYTMIAGPTWQPPSEVGDGLSLSQRIDQLTVKMNRLDEQIEKTRTQLAKSKEPARTPTSGLEERGGGGGGGKGGAGGGGGEAPPPPSSTPRKEPPGRKPKENPIEQKLNKTVADREKLQKEIEELKAKQASGGKEAPTNDLTRTAFLDNPKVRMWVHDVTAEPGAMYRYRLRVVTNNPFFGREAALTPEQKELAASSLSSGEWSDWTDPVSVDRKTYYFITGASERDAVGPARASAELMEFYYGYFRLATVGLSPGDAVVGEAKLPANLKVFDLEKLALAVKPQGSAPGDPAAGGKGAGRGGSGQVPTSRTEAPPAGPPGTDKAAGDGSKPLPERRSIATEALLVDVQGGQGGAGPRVVIREAPGLIVMKTPEASGRGTLLARLRESAKQGESQGQPQVKPREAKVDVAPTERPNQERTRDTPPSGGGGGGGG